jgi:hypothetical protein
MSNQSFWDEQQPRFDIIEKDGMQSFVQTIPNFSEAFVLQDRTLRCMDEGTPGGIHAAGSCILMTQDEAIAFAAHANLDGISSHQSCGACGLYAKDAHVHENDPDACGPEWSQKFAELVHLPYTGSIEAKDMHRPADMHIARIAYYDGTGSFDYARVFELPPGFVISRAFFDPAYAAKEATIAASIALGHHGFGDAFTKGHPFRLVAIGVNADQLATLKSELEVVAAPFEGRAIVDGFLK